MSYQYLSYLTTEEKYFLPYKQDEIIQVFLSFFFFFKLWVYLFIYGCVGSSFLCEGFLQLQQVGAILHRGAQASHYRGLVAEYRLQTHRLSNCGSRAQSLRGRWDPPRPGLEPVSPAPAGRSPTAAPPGKHGVVLTAGRPSCYRGRTLTGLNKDRDHFFFQKLLSIKEIVLLI